MGTADDAEVMTIGEQATEVAEAIRETAEQVSGVKLGLDGQFSLDGQKLLNLGFLVAFGSWGLHSITTVDADLWRGWTTQEIMLRLPYDNWGSYTSGLQEHPILTKTLINVVIYLVGDWAAQVEWGRNNHDLLEFDLPRTLRNGLIGAFFGPLVHWYYDWSDFVLPTDVPINKPLKILMDQTVYFATKCSVYICLVGLLRGDSLEEVKTQWQTRIWKVLTTGWKFWPGVHVFTYGFIPAQHRVLWVNMVDLLWSSILSGLSTGAQPEETPQPESAAGSALQDPAAAAAPAPEHDNLQSKDRPSGPTAVDKNL